MDVLTLYFGGKVASQHVLGSRPVAVGRSAACDIVVNDPTVALHRWLVAARRGAVVCHDLQAPDRRASPRLLPAGGELRLGDHHVLCRTWQEAGAEADCVRDPSTEAIVAQASPTGEALVLRVGRAGDARRLRLGDRPLQIGTASHNDLVLLDRAVSGEHCRIEPTAFGVQVRDLGSRNGTFVQGVPVARGDLMPGTALRVGRTELLVVEDTDANAARDQLVAASEALQDVLRDARRWSGLSWPVLVLGESGVGKEGVARLLHEAGPRAKQPMVALNAGGLPKELIESELFGHERGAFTGAMVTHRGVFEQADGGTLFLDEIGELPLSLQARLLRVLETGELRRVGAERHIRVDVRLVCATHRDLRAMVSEGTFRRDLYYRIARLLLDVPPLRERVEDLEALSDHFLSAVRADVGYRTLTAAARARLACHPWPGNARELRNVISVAAVLTSGQHIDDLEIDLALRRVGGAQQCDAVPLASLRRVVDAHHGNLSAAARVLGIARSTLRDRLRVGA